MVKNWDMFYCMYRIEIKLKCTFSNNPSRTNLLRVHNYVAWSQRKFQVSDVTRDSYSPFFLLWFQNRVGENIILRFFSLCILSRGHDQNTSTVDEYFDELDDGVKGTSFMNILIKDCVMAFLHLSKLYVSKNANMAYDDHYNHFWWYGISPVRWDIYLWQITFYR